MIAQWSGFASTGTTAGLFTNLGSSITDTSDDAVGGGTGCTYPGNSNGVRQDFCLLPRDGCVYKPHRPAATRNPATYTAGPYQGQIRIDKPITIGDASMNAFDNAGIQVRNDAGLGVVTYAIGLGRSTRAGASGRRADAAGGQRSGESDFRQHENSPGCMCFAPDNTPVAAGLRASGVGDSANFAVA